MSCIFRFKEWLDVLLWESETPQEQVYRMKGILNVTGSNRRHVFQAVRDLYDIVEGPSWGEAETQESRIVVIGQNLNFKSMSDSFQSCLEI